MQNITLFFLFHLGYYRVNYDDASWKMLSETLNSEDRKTIHTQNRAQVFG